MRNSNDRLLEHVFIAAPCSVDWNTMVDDERTRFCGQCKLNVYNVSELSSKDAVNIIRSSEERVCLKLFRRLDGSIITDDCPVGLKWVRDRARLFVAASLAVFASVRFVSNAYAQGMVGAPVDPRLGMSGEVNSIVNIAPAAPPIWPALLWLAISIWQKLQFWLVGCGLIVIYLALDAFMGYSTIRGALT